MVLTLTAVALLAAGPLRVAAPGLTVTGIPEGQGEAFSEHLASQLRSRSGYAYSRAIAATIFSSSSSPA